MKKLLSILLVCAMMVSLIPVYASAEEENHDAWNAVMEDMGQPTVINGAAPNEDLMANFKSTRDIGDQSYYENEYNNEPFYADMLQNDYTVYGTVSGYDLDYFAFEITTPSNVVFVSVSPSDGPWLGIYDETDNACLTYADIYYDSQYGYYNNVIEHYLTPGLYYLVMLDYNTSSTDQEYMFYYASAATSAAHYHDYTCDYAVYPAPTCTATGTQRNYCSCGAWSGVTLPANGHTYNTGTVTTQPTCSKPGTRLLTCVDCGATKTESVPTIAHTFVNGYCRVCGEREPLFPDAPWGQYYSTPIEWAVNSGITNGYPNGLFGTEDTCNRAQVVTFLWRAAGSPRPTSTNHNFTDIVPGQYYYDAVLWAVEKGITTGLSATTFGPDQPCNRGQVVTFLWRYNNKPAPTSYNCPFTDVDPAQFYYLPILWAYQNGVTTGTSSTSFSPSNPCTRGQVVTFLYRAVV